MKKFLIGLLFILLLVGIALGIFFWGTLKQVTVHSKFSPSPSPVPKVEGFNGLEPLNILLMGYGGGGHAGGKLTDTVMLVSIQPKTKQVFLISIPRDLWVPVPINGDQSTFMKINAAYAIGADDKGYKNKKEQFTGAAGGGELAKFVVSNVTGLSVNRFATLDFNGFKKTIDTLGGVNVKVDKTFDDYHYPIEGKEDDTCEKTPEDIASLTATMSGDTLDQQFTCRYEVLHFDAGKTFMDGATALKYVRSRHSAQDGGDFNRGARQRNLLLAVKDKVLALDFFPKIIPFTASLANDLTMDVSLDDIQEFLKYKDDLTKYHVVNLAFTQENVLTISTTPGGQSIVTPKQGIGQYGDLQIWLKNQMAAAATSSAQISSASAKPITAPTTK
ncbi:N/A [soil metagenome]